MVDHLTLAHFDVPTLIVHGDADRIGIPGKKSHALIPESRYDVLKGVPHGFAATHAAERNELLLDFVTQGT